MLLHATVLALRARPHVNTGVRHHLWNCAIHGPYLMTGRSWKSSLPSAQFVRDSSCSRCRLRSRCIRSTKAAKRG